MNPRMKIPLGELALASAAGSQGIDQREHLVERRIAQGGGRDTSVQGF
jgi:hypothetical protein